MPTPTSPHTDEERRIARARSFAELRGAVQAIWGHRVGSDERDRLCDLASRRTFELWQIEHGPAAEIIRRTAL